MDISRQAEIVLRNEGYRTWSLYEGSTLVICFENVSLIGFLCVFDSADALLHRWRETQNSILRRRREALRTAREKAWNVYFVFLTGDGTPGVQRTIERLEEDLSLSRKIACGGIVTMRDVQRALLPLTAIQTRAALSVDDFERRLRVRLKDIPSESLAAFLSNVSVSDVAMILVDYS